MADDITYHGYRPEVGAAVIEIRSGGQTVGVLAHVPRHSPNGMQWGYAGSGPADCARSLLIAALGEAASCRACKGERRLYFTDDDRVTAPASEAPPIGAAPERFARCFECEDGYRPLPYQDFKFEHVAGWGDTWTMSQADIVAWLRERGIEA